MATKGVIGILTGGGDVPGLNPAIRAVTIRALREGYKVIGLRRGWGGIIDVIRDKDYDNSANFIELTKQVVDKAARTGGTFLHTSRTKPSKVAKNVVPEHLKDTYTDEINDLTPEVIKNLEWIGIDHLIATGGDDTLSYAVHLNDQGVKVNAIPKTMDNDVPGTDYCIGFSTCISRTISLINNLRTSAGSHERIMVLEVFGRYAGFTAMLPTMAGAAHRCVIPEHEFDVAKLTEMLVKDRFDNPSNYSIVLVAEGAKIKGRDMMFADDEKDAYGHAKLGGIGDIVSNQIKELSGQFNNGRKLNTISQKLGYMVRCGDPDAMDAIVPMAYGTLAFDLIKKGESGKLVCLQHGQYGSVPINTVTSMSKVVDVEKHYDTDRYHPFYHDLDGLPMMIMTTKYSV